MDITWIEGPMGTQTDAFLTSTEETPKGPRTSHLANGEG
jgi:hypothetical protein